MFESVANFFVAFIYSRGGDLAFFGGGALVQLTWIWVTEFHGRMRCPVCGHGRLNKHPTYHPEHGLLYRLCSNCGWVHKAKPAGVV